MIFNRKNFDTKQRFGIRKLSVGTCSVLLATLFLGVSIEQVPKVHADVVDQNNDTQLDAATESPKGKAYTLSNSSATTSENADSSDNSSSSDSQAISSASASSESAQTVENKSAQTESSADTATDTENSTASQSTESASDSTSADNTSTVSDSTSSVSSAELANDSNALTATVKTPNDVNIVTPVIPHAAAAENVVATTTEASSATEADTIKANAGVTITSTDGKYTLYISRTTWGNTSDGTQPIQILLSGNTGAGDVVKIYTPNYGIVSAQAPTMNPAYGSASQTTEGNNNVITFNFVTSATVNPIITIPSDNGYGAKGTPMSISYPTEEPITWTVNGVEQQSTNLLIDINPIWNPTPLTRTDPNPNSTSPTALKKMIPNFKTVYQFKVNENNGVTSSTTYSSSVVNSAVNYGTIITIPMPKGFVLDQSATMALNNFGDQTTVTQSGNNIIINVPKGSGKQGYNSPSTGYQIVGTYNIPMPSTATTLTADAPITIVQNLDESGTYTKNYTGETVSEDFYGADETIPLGNMAMSSQAAYSTAQLLNNGQKQVVSYFGITNGSISSFSDYSSTITLTFDSDLGVTEIKTPTMVGTSNYRYTITYADGSTSTGQVDAGQTISGGSVITKIEINPDNFEITSGTSTSLPSNNFTNQTQTQTNAFEAYGSIATTVPVGTKLYSNMSFSGVVTTGGTTQFLTASLSKPVEQVVLTPSELTSNIGVWSNQQSTAAGQQNAATLSVSAPFVSIQTRNVYEPIFYYVLPEWFSYNSITSLNSNNGVTGEPKITVFAVPTDVEGLSRQVVKIDYTGTGYNFDAASGASDRVNMNSLADGVNATYQGMIYVVSSTTKLTNTAYNADNTSNFAPSGITFNPAWVQNNTDSLYYLGNQAFKINQVGGANTASTAQGNQNQMLVDSAVSNVYGTDEMQYAVRLINESGNDLTNVVALINLPQATDNNGTSFTFQLNSRPVYNGSAEDKSHYTFLYSTELGDLLSNSDPDGSKPDETGYVTADEVTDWTKIKSIIVKTDSMSAHQRSERLIFTGVDDNLVNDAGKVGYISTGFYSDTTKPFVSSKAVYDSSTVANKVKPGNITVSGNATINFQLHYVDENGQDQTIALPDLTTSYNLASDSTMMTEQQAIALANQKDADKIPANYEISSATIAAGGKSWQTDAPEGTPAFGGIVQYYYNNATVTLEATPIQRTLTYQVIDENNPSSPVTITPSTNLLVNGQPVTGNQGSDVPTDATTAYDTIKSQLEAEGYVISSNSSTVPTTFGSDNTALTIYVTHGTTDVSTPSEWPSTVSSSDRVALSKDITRTITVAGLPTTVDGATQTVNYTRTAVVDNVTHKVIGYVNPSDTSQTITDGDQAWTSTDDTWPAFTPSNVPAGYSISSITDANGNYANVTSENGQLTGVAEVTVPASDSDVNVTITYKGDAVSNTIKFVDADNNDAQVGETQTINGNVGETQTLNLTIPAGYELQSGATLPTSYTFGATNTPIVIPLVHKTTQVGPNGTWPSTSTDADKVPLTETVSRTINVTGLPSTVAPTVQNVEFTRTAIVDEVTGKVVGYVDPSDSTKTITNGDDAWVAPTDSSWAEWTNSNAPEGYYISSATLADGSNYSDVTEQNGIITGLSSVNVTPTTSDTVVNVNYAKVDLDLTINHDTITNTYNGSAQPVSADVISAITHTVESSNSNVPVTTIADAIAKANLTSDDYSYADSEGNVLSGAPTDAGNYHIILNASGLAKINQVAGGLTVNYDPTKSYVNYVIAPAAATATLSGDNSKTYDGQAVTTAEVTKDGNISISANVPGTTLPAYVLKDGDYIWYNADGTELTSAPTNVGNYTIKLSDQGIANLKSYYGNSNNITWADDAISGSATYEINAATATVTLSPDTNKQTNSWTGSEIPVDPTDFVPTITTDNGETLTVPAGTLTAGDYTVSSSPVDPGTYQVTLTESGLEKIKNAISTSGNYTWSSTGNGTLTITNAKADYQLSGSSETTYTGSQITTPIDELKNAISSSNTVSGQDLVIPDLTDSDFTWNTPDGSAPTNAGDYTITLSESGQNKIKAANPNYDLTLGTNSFTYTVKAADATAKLAGENGKTYDGSAVTTAEVNSNGQIQVTMDYLGKTQTYSLQDGDYTWNTSDGSAPSDVGNYTITLTETGLTHLQEAINQENGEGNVTLTGSATTDGSATYKITAASITVSGDGSQTNVYNGKTPTIDPSNFPITLTPQDGAPTPTIPAGTLTSSDFVVKNSDGETVTPTNTGDYTVYLTPEGLEKLQNLYPNYTWPTTDQSVGTLTIKAATTTATVAGSNSKTYDGKAISTDDLYTDGSTISVKIKGIDPNIEIPYTLQDGDYTWNTADPTNAGTYTFTLTIEGVAHLQDALNKQYGDGNVTISSSDVTGNASFTIDKATATVDFTGNGQSPVEYTGETGKFNASDYPVSISTNNGLTVNVPSDVNLSVADGDFVFTDGNGNSQTTEPTAIGSYTVTLSDSGFKKLQSQTDNYNWVNDAKGTYSITKAENVSVTLSGSQDKTYTASEFANGDIDVNDYSVTLGNGLTYKLVAGDLEFVPGQDPTNVGTYQVQLSAQGKANIAKLQSDNYSYNFDNVGTANFNVTKATPSASFIGQGSKTYDGTPISGYEPSVTITAPGQNSVTLSAGTDYVWTKDGQNYTTAPSDAGDYTVTLTQEGINKIKAVNADNLDWSNVTISQDASYDINKATATVNFDNPGSQTVEYGEGTFNADDFNPAISTNNNVTVNVPDGVNLSVVDGDYVFTDTNGSTQTTVPTELGTYTVTLSDSGFAKLQSQTNNYDWVNNAKGTYTVSKATNVPVTLTNVRDGQKVTYTGNEFTNGAIDPSDYQVTLGNGKTYQLVDGDLEFVPSQDPTNVGTYQVQLSEQGKEHIEALDPTHYSYDFSNAGTGSFEIEKATPSVEFTADASKTFDGTPIVLDKYTTQPTVTVTAPGNPTITLEVGDYVWVDQVGNTYTTAPSNVGNYTIQLSEQGKNKILQNTTNADNLDWANAKINGEGSYTITEATATATLSGSASKTYDGQPVTTTEINGNGDIEVTVKIPNSDETVTYRLKDGDYTWNTPNGDAPTNAGEYTITLSPNVVANLQSAIDDKFGKGNVTISTSGFKGSATFTITPANMKVTMSGNGSKVSDGQPANVDLDTLVNSLTGTNLNKTGLTSDDFSWNTPDGKAPHTVGTYTISLNENGLKKLQGNNPDYKITVDGSYTYTITAASQKVEYVDENGNVIKTIDNIAGTDTNYGTTIDFNAQGNLPTNYELVDPNQATMGIKVVNGVIQIKVKAATETTTESKTVIRTIIVENPDGTTTTVTQPVTFTRTVTTNKVTGEKTYGEWNQPTGTWGEYTPTAIPGYSISNVPAETVTPDTADQTVKISYTKNPPVATTETKMVTRTIIVEMPDGQRITVKQTVTFTRTKYTDIATGEVTYGEWDKVSGEWNAYNAPEIEGYTSKPVLAETVTPTSDDKTVIVTYTKNPVEPVNPGNPDTPVTPENPTTPTDVPGSNDQQNNGINSNETTNEVNTPANDQSATNGQKQVKLPQTGNEKNEWGIASGLLAATLGLFGLAGTRRKKKED
ncbi:MBG domain-containing protein [Lactobacillaceae bacterium 24-114]